MVKPGSDSVEGPPRRAVILGASNVARGFPTIVQTARWACGSPLEILAAMGRGRSFGMQTSLLGRKISGISECGLWRALVERPNADSIALVTDIGNDLLYGISVSQLLDWIENCLDRLDAAGCRTVITELPIESAQALSEWKYRLVRSILVPSSRLPFHAMLERCTQLNDALRELPTKRKVAIIPQKIAWFGVDPIHIKRSSWAAAWHEILLPWSKERPLVDPAACSISEALYLHWRVPQERRVWGYTQRREQPSCRLQDGTTIALY